MEVRYERKALKAFRRMPRRDMVRIRNALREIAAGNTQDKDIGKLTDRPGYRLRIGKYRALYLIDKDSGHLVLLVLKVGSRGGFYR